MRNVIIRVAISACFMHQNCGHLLISLSLYNSASYSRECLYCPIWSAL